MSVNRRRVKVGATLDPDFVAVVDAYVADNPGSDRSAVLDDALQLWCERQQELAMERQFSAPASKQQLTERAAWRRIRTAATRRTLSKRR